MSASTSSQVSNASTTNSASIAAFHNSRKKFKLLVIGSASVGKTSVLRQFVYHTFDPKSTQTTIGCDFWHRNLTVNYAPSSNNNNNKNKPSSDQLNNSNNENNNNNNNNKTKSVTAQLAVWDTAGMDAGFESLAPSFFRGADGAMLVYDLTNPQSFHQAKSWRDKFVAHAGYQAPILLVGNKIDLVEQRKVTKEMADEFVRESIQIANDSQSSLMQAANNNNNKGILVCGHVEITAADSEAVEAAFVQLTQAMLEVEKTRSASEIVSQKDLKRVRLGSVPPGTGKDAAAAAGAGSGKKCAC